MQRLRIDRWLWHARFFKTRSLAAEEVKAGHVRVNGGRAKPAHEIKVGDVLAIVRGEDEREIVVERIPPRRGPSTEAATCYAETEASLERGRLRAAERVSTVAIPPPTLGRPDKRTRRLIAKRKSAF